MKRPGIGDVFTIFIENTQYFLQIVAKVPVFGELIRVSSNQPFDYADDDLIKTHFRILFPVSDAFRQGLIQYVARHFLPPAYRPPVFLRYSPGDPPTGELRRWLLTDTIPNGIVTNLTDEQRSWPLAIAVNMAALENLIRSGWSDKVEDPYTNLPI